MMKINLSVIHTFCAIACALLLNNASFAEPANLALLRQEVQTYHDSGAYDKELTNVITRAKSFIIKRAAFNAHTTHPKKLAVVLDIDETSLSNYDKLVAREFIGDKKLIHQEILAANSPAIKPMQSFYNVALKYHVSVFFVTGRKESERNATTKNLKQAGYHDWAGLYLKPGTYKQLSNIPYKSSTRADISKQGYTIIASIGDQDSDLKGGYTEKTFKLPNPYYYLP